jgi:hypothetical protein
VLADRLRLVAKDAGARCRIYPRAANRLYASLTSSAEGSFREAS